MPNAEKIFQKGKTKFETNNIYILYNTLIISIKKWML